MKVVRHSHHEQFLRLANEDAALLVSSGRWVYTSKFEARKVTPRQERPLWLRIGMFVTTLAMIVAVLLLSSAAKATDLKVPKRPTEPYKACLTQAQAAEVYPGKYLKYRQIGKERCYYAGARLPKHVFIPNAAVKAVAGRSPVPSTPAALFSPGDLASRRGEPALDPRATGVAVTPARLPTQDSARVQAAPAGSIPDVGATLQDMAEDAFLALTGMPETYWTFDSYWSRMMGWPR